MQIHPTAIIDDGAEISASVKIGAYSIIEKDVKIGENTTIAPYVHIMGNTIIGENNKIYTGAVLGYDPQDKSYDSNRNTGIKIGDNNTIREHVTIHLSTKDNSYTKIGNNCYLMVGSHVAHDCVLEDNVTIVNAGLLAGHVVIEKNAFLSGGVGVHQYCRIGAYAMIGVNEKIAQDVVPFTLINDFPARAVGINVVGLRRAGFSTEQRKNLKLAYKIIFREKLPTSKIIERLEDSFDDPNIDYIINFLKKSVNEGRGFIKK